MNRKDLKVHCELTLRKHPSTSIRAEHELILEILKENEELKSKKFSMDELKEQFESIYDYPPEIDGVNYIDDYITEGWKCYIVCAVANNLIKSIK